MVWQMFEKSGSRTELEDTKGVTCRRSGGYKDRTNLLLEGSRRLRDFGVSRGSKNLTTRIRTAVARWY